MRRCVVGVVEWAKEEKKIQQRQRRYRVIGWRWGYCASEQTIFKGLLFMTMQEKKLSEVYLENVKQLNLLTNLVHPPAKTGWL